MGYSTPKSHGWKQRPNPGGGGGASAPYSEWVDLDLDTAKWSVVGNNGAGETYVNAWAATNSGDKLIITAGIEDVKAAGNKVEYNPTEGDPVVPGFALIYKDHMDCTPAGTPTGVTAETFYSEYAIITVRMQFGQVGTASSGCGYGIGGNTADDTDPWGGGAKGSATRCGVGWAFYSTDQSGNPTAPPKCDSLNNYAQIFRTDKQDNQADGHSQLEFLTIAPGDGASPSLRDNTVHSGVNTDLNFGNAGSVSLREGTSDTTDFDQMFMQIGGFPTVSDANAGVSAASINEGSVRMWLANSANDDLDSLPALATGPLIDYNIQHTEQMRHLGSYAHPWIMVDQRGNSGYTDPERVHVVIEKVSVLVQAIAGRRSF